MEVPSRQVYALDLSYTVIMSGMIRSLLVHLQRTNNIHTYILPNETSPRTTGLHPNKESFADSGYRYSCVPAPVRDGLDN